MTGVEAFGPLLMQFGRIQMARHPPNVLGIIGLSLLPSTNPIRMFHSSSSKQLANESIVEFLERFRQMRSKYRAHLAVKVTRVEQFINGKNQRKFLRGERNPQTISMVLEEENGLDDNLFVDQIETKIIKGKPYSCPALRFFKELEDFELDGLLSKDALIPMTDVGILLMEFTSQDQLMATIKCDVLADEGE
ncbi:hypothetical protein JHK86_018331 [Glycine max]|nr:hypothetical protein JHK86_018331 [Glycine max]